MLGIGLTTLAVFGACLCVDSAVCDAVATGRRTRLHGHVFLSVPGADWLWRSGGAPKNFVAHRRWMLGVTAAALSPLTQRMLPHDHLTAGAAYAETATR
jgi:hypothetical protein